MSALTWGTFTAQHFISIALAPVIAFALYALCRKLSEKRGTALLLILSLWGYAAMLYNLLSWGEPLAYLPLHMCSINAVFLPIALLSRRQMLKNMLPVFALGALSAVICNQGMADAKLGSWVFIMYYVPHVMEFCIPLVMLLTRRILLLPRLILPVALCMLALAAGVHGCNEVINTYLIDPETADFVNYMYTCDPEGFPILTDLWELNPRKFWYLMPLLPVIALFQLLINLPGMLRRRRAQGTGRGERYFLLRRK